MLKSMGVKLSDNYFQDGLPPMGTKGLGITSVKGISRVPLPPARMIARMPLNLPNYSLGKPYLRNQNFLIFIYIFGKITRDERGQTLV
jgi:hypothetical protein